jgi:hypothetical protein
MKNRNSTSLLTTSIRILARDYKRFFFSYFGIMTILYLIEIFVSKISDVVRIGGIESIYSIACLASGLSTFKESYFLLTQNQVPKPTITKAFVIEGFGFGLLSSILVNLYFHLVEWISSSLGLYTPGFLALFPTIEKQGVSGGFFGRLVVLFFLYTALYFFGLLLAVINYRLNWLGRVIFWVPFGTITLNAFIAVMEHSWDGVPLEKLDVPSQFLAKPFIHSIDWILHSLGHFAISSVAVMTVCLILGTLIFRGAEIKYSNVK